MPSEILVQPDSSFRRSPKVGQYLNLFFDQLNDGGIKYCVLHSYEGLPDYAPSDVDMVVASGDLNRVESILFNVADSLGFQVIQKLYYDIPKCYYYVLFFRDTNGNTGFVQLDFLNDEYGVGRYILKTPTLLAGRRRYKNFFIPSVTVEACYLIIKKVVKGVFLPEHIAKLQGLLREDEAGVKDTIACYFGKSRVSDVLSLIEGAPGTVEKRNTIKMLNRFLLMRYTICRPHILLLSTLWLAMRVVARLFSPTGLVVVFLSPDGGGKSTVADLLLSRMHYGFRNTKRIHWRPYLLPSPHKLMHPGRWKEPESPNYTPHSLPPKSVTSSVARLLYYFADYILGYPPKVLWPKIRTHLVIFERYYYDLLIDTKRFRFNIPAWLPAFLLPFVPKPDLLFLLTGPPEILFSRKQEISLEEIKRQIQVIDLLSAEFPNSHKINIDQPLEDEVRQIENIILDVLEKRLKKKTGQGSCG